jgi:hypothetical protein
MEIDLKKINISNHVLSIVRMDKTMEQTTLDTDTYLLHDICHFYVEAELGTPDGFWGMLAQGYRIEQLVGKTNHLTEKLRTIECIVGGIQSVYSKHMDELFFRNYIQKINYDLPDQDFVKKVIPG